MKVTQRLIDRELEDALLRDIVVTVDGVTYTLPAKVADLIQEERDDLRHMSRALIELVEYAIHENPFSVDMSEDPDDQAFFEYVGKPYASLTKEDLRKLYDLFDTYNDDDDRSEEGAWYVAIRDFVRDVKKANPA